MTAREASRAHIRAAARTGLSWTAIGIVVVLLLAVGFARLSDEVTENEFAPFDRAVALGIHGGASATQTAVMLQVTNLGFAYLLALVAVAVLVGAFVAWRTPATGRRGWLVTARDVLAPAISAGVAGGLALIIKAIVGRARPQLFPPLAPESGPSFPSGHTLVAIAFYGMCAFLLARPARGWARAGVVALGVLLPLAVAYSRVYLGVHYPTDVIGSMILGLAWLISATIALLFAERHLARAHSAATSASHEANATGATGATGAAPPAQG